MKEKIKKITKELIRIRSAKENPEEIKRVADFCESLFSKKEFTVKRFKRNGKHSLVITFKGEKTPELFLVGHLDVVGAEKKQFTPKEKKGKIYGRGAKDNKGPSAVLVTLMKELSSLERKPSVGLLLTTDEESGGFDGVSYVLNEKEYTPKIGFIPDGGDDFEIIFSEKGVLHFRLIAKGRAAHGARPFEGENAIDKVIEAYSRLKKEFPNPKERDDWRTSLNAGKISGGSATNVVAEKAEMFLDVRFTNEWTEKKIVKRIKELVGKEIEVEVDISGPAFYTSPKNPYVKKYAETLEEILKREPVFEKYPPASDARFFSQKKIPAIITNVRGGGTHGKDEWVSVKSLEDLYRVMKEFITRHF